MKKPQATIVFICPECHSAFEFDFLGESEFVPCPVCGTDCITVKKGKKLVLENLDLSQRCQTPEIWA